MNTRYELLLAAYQTRDGYCLTMFLIALLVVFTAWQLRTMRRISFLFHAYILLAWLGVCIYAFTGHGI